MAEALAGAQVVIDLANSPSFEDKAVLEFFEISGRNLLAAGKVAGVKHHVALSIVGAERLPKSGYLRAKMAQERLIRKSGIPYTIVHSTQFFEFLGGIAQSATVGDTVTLPSAYFQPIASDDVADIMTDVALSPPINGVVEIAGPEPVRMSDLVALPEGDQRSAQGDGIPTPSISAPNWTTARSSPATIRASAQCASKTGSAELRSNSTDIPVPRPTRHQIPRGPQAQTRRERDYERQLSFPSGASRRDVLLGALAASVAASLPVTAACAGEVGDDLPSSRPGKGPITMSTITTKDGTEIYYKDWGPEDAQPIVFHHGWPLSGDDWDAQMLYFLDKGYRVIAHDRRGHGRSAR